MILGKVLGLQTFTMLQLKAGLFFLLQSRNTFLPYLYSIFLKTRKTLLAEVMEESPGI